MDDRYAAGLFDGEGWVRIGRWHKPQSTHIRYSVYTGIGLSHFPIMEKWQETYGGTLHMNRHDLRNPKARIQFCWSVGSQVACTFLRRIVPFSFVKKDEIEIALALQEHIDCNPYVPAGRNSQRDNRNELIAYREELFNQITALKKRTFPPLTA